MGGVDLFALVAVPLLALAAFWCWTETRRTTRHWRTATFVTVVVAVAAAVVSEALTGTSFRGGGWKNPTGAAVAFLGWVAVAVAARLRRRRR
jgi:hypothetical protein